MKKFTEDDRTKKFKTNYYMSLLNAFLYGWLAIIIPIYTMLMHGDILLSFVGGALAFIIALINALEAGLNEHILIERGDRL